MPTIAQQWIEQGISIGEKEGWTKGHQEGREEGREEATLKALHQSLTIRFEVTLGEFDKQFERLIWTYPLTMSILSCIMLLIYYAITSQG